MAAIKKVSLKDIAARAGVSTALVSFVLNDKGRQYRVGEETEKHILRIAKDMNYQPNIAAKSLRSGKTGAIGVVISDISNPFFSQLARFIEDEAAKKGYTVFFGSSDEDAQKMHSLIVSLLSRGVDGLIIVPAEKSEASIESLLDGDTPVVLLDRPIPGMNISSVSLNNFQAGYMATQHLIDAGFRSVGVVGYDISLSHMKDRIRGYKKAMIDNGLRASVNIGYLRPDNARKTAEKVITKMVSAGVDSLLFATNTISIACLHYIVDCGLRVPADLGLVGFDGSDAFDFFYSPLTYVKQPTDLLACKAMDILIDSIANNNSIQHVMVEGSLIERASSRR